MIPIKPALCAWFSLVLCLCSAPTLASQASDQALGDPFFFPQFQGDNAAEAVARSADGDFVVIWQRADASAAEVDVFARCFTASGFPKGDAFQVNVTVPGNQLSSDVSMTPDGRFAVSWVSNPSAGGVPAAGYGIVARQFDADCRPSGGEIQVSDIDPSSNSTQPVSSPCIASDTEGAFVVGWRDISRQTSASLVKARIFSPQGIARGVPFTVNNRFSVFFTTLVGMTPSGSFVVAWDSLEIPGGPFTNFRRYASNGTPLSDETRISPSDTVDGLIVNADGSCVVIWLDGRAIISTRLSSDGQVQGSQRVNLSDREPSIPVIAHDGNGGYLIAWGENDVIKARRYNSADQPQTGELLLQTNRPPNGLPPNVLAMDADGDYLIAFEQVFRRFSGIQAVNLGISIIESADPVAPNASYRYTVRVRNEERATSPTAFAAINAGFGVSSGSFARVRFPVDNPPQAITAPDWSCAQLAGLLECRMRGKLRPGASSDIALDMRAPNSSGQVSVSATLDGDQIENTPANNGFTANTSVGGTTAAADTAFSSSSGGDAGGGDGRFGSGGGGAWGALFLLPLLLAAFRRPPCSHARS